MTQVELTPEVVKYRVQQLNGLFDDIEEDFLPQIINVRAAQTSTTWSSAPPAVQFRTSMRNALNTAEANLRTLWGRVKELCDTLEQNAADLTTLDDDARAELARLLERAQTPPEMPAPTTTPPYAPGATTPGPWAPRPLMDPPLLTPWMPPAPATPSAPSGPTIQPEWDAEK
ncbi:hypothetical protein [Actinotalea sp. JY-7885]|uniref:hypothetical protein n=1 Tax=Actinotalea sp. JY-7885 TaxID=2758576 RepID=UPI00165E15BD|nr:hypothetical protein [Actinotalea sp. JY-7885]